MLKDNIAVIAVLEMKNKSDNPNQRDIVIVANTHIHWNPEFSDVKLVQTQIFTEKLTELRKKYKMPPLIVCGDFNSTPDSGVYELITKGKVSASHPELLSFKYGKYTQQGMSHELPLISCYGMYGEPAFTNYTTDFIGVLDYIFCTQDNCKPSNVLAPPNEDDILSYNGALPNPFNCSDHILLFGTILVKFSEKPQETK